MTTTITINPKTWSKATDFDLNSTANDFKFVADDGTTTIAMKNEMVGDDLISSASVSYYATAVVTNKDGVSGDTLVFDNNAITGTTKGATYRFELAQYDSTNDDKLLGNYLWRSVAEYNPDGSVKTPAITYQTGGRNVYVNLDNADAINTTVGGWDFGTLHISDLKIYQVVNGTSYEITDTYKSAISALYSDSSITDPYHYDYNEGLVAASGDFSYTFNNFGGEGVISPLEINDQNMAVGPDGVTPWVVKADEDVFAGTRLNETAISTDEDEVFALGTGADTIKFNGEIGDDTVIKNTDETIVLDFDTTGKTTDADSVTTTTAFTDAYVKGSDVVVDYEEYQNVDFTKTTTTYEKTSDPKTLESYSTVYKKDVISYSADKVTATYSEFKVESTEATFTRIGTTVSNSAETSGEHQGEFAVTVKHYTYNFGSNTWTLSSTDPVSYVTTAGDNKEKYSAYKRGDADYTYTTDAALADTRYDVKTTTAVYKNLGTDTVANWAYDVDNATEATVQGATAINHTWKFEMQLDSKTIGTPADTSKVVIGNQPGQYYLKTVANYEYKNASTTSTPDWKWDGDPTYTAVDAKGTDSKFEVTKQYKKASDSSLTTAEVVKGADDTFVPVDYDTVYRKETTELYNYNGTSFVKDSSKTADEFVADSSSLKDSTVYLQINTGSKTGDLLDSTIITVDESKSEDMAALAALYNSGNPNTDLDSVSLGSATVSGLAASKEAGVKLGSFDLATDQYVLDAGVTVGSKLNDLATSTSASEKFELGESNTAYNSDGSVKDGRYDEINFSGKIGQDQVVVTKGETVKLNFDSMGTNAYTIGEVSGNNAKVNYYETNSVNIVEDKTVYATEASYNVYNKTVTEYSSTKQATTYTGSEVNAEEAVFSKYTDVKVASEPVAAGNEHAGEYLVTAKVATWDFTKATPAYGEATATQFYVTAAQKTTIGTNTTIYSRNDDITVADTADKAAVRYDITTHHYEYKNTAGSGQAANWTWAEATGYPQTTQAATKEAAQDAKYEITVAGHKVDESDTPYALTGEPTQLYLKTVTKFKTNHANSWSADGEAQYEGVESNADRTVVIIRTDRDGVTKTTITDYGTATADTYLPTDAATAYWKETKTVANFDGDEYVVDATKTAIDYKTAQGTDVTTYTKKEFAWTDPTHAVTSTVVTGDDKTAAEALYTGSDSALLGTVTVNDYYSKKFDGSVLIGSLNDELADTIYTVQEADAKGNVIGTDKNDYAYSTKNPEKFDLKAGDDSIYFSGVIANDEVKVSKNETLNLDFDNFNGFVRYNHVEGNDVIAKYYETTFFSYSERNVAYTATAKTPTFEGEKVEAAEAVFTRVGTTIAKEAGTDGKYAVTQQNYKYDFATSKWVAVGDPKSLDPVTTQGTGVETFDTYKRNTADYTYTTDAALATTRYDLTTTSFAYQNTATTGTPVYEWIKTGTTTSQAASTETAHDAEYRMLVDSIVVRKESDAFNDIDPTKKYFAKTITETDYTGSGSVWGEADVENTYVEAVNDALPEGAESAGNTYWCENSVTGDIDKLSATSRTAVEALPSSDELIYEDGSADLGQVAIKDYAKKLADGAVVKVDGDDLADNTNFLATVDADGNAKGTRLGEVFTSNNDNENTINLGSGKDTITLSGEFGRDTIISNKDEDLSVVLEANTYYNNDDVVANGKNLEIDIYTKVKVGYYQKVVTVANGTGEEAAKKFETTVIKAYNGTDYSTDVSSTKVEVAATTPDSTTTTYARTYAIDGAVAYTDPYAAAVPVTTDYGTFEVAAAGHEDIIYRGTVVFKDVVGKNTGADIKFDGNSIDTLTKNVFSFDENDLEDNNGKFKGSALSEKIDASAYRSENAKGVNINSGSGSDYIEGSNYNDTVKVNTMAGEAAYVKQTGGTNKVTFGKGNDMYDGYGYASSTVNAGAGDNTIAINGGSLGTNKITAKDGSNTVGIAGGFNTVKLGNAKTTTDTTLGAYAHNSIALAGGQNKVTSGKGIDEFAITAGINNISSGNGADKFSITDGYNTIKTGSGDKTFATLVAGEYTGVGISDGTNVITTGKGNDKFIISGGNNVIKSGAGNDSFKVSDAGLVYTMLDGGKGNDIYDVSAITDYSTMADDINIKDTKGTNTLVLAARDDIFFDVTVGKGTKFKDATTGKTIKYTVGSEMEFINEGDLTVANLDNGTIKGIEVAGKNAIKNVQVGASSYTLDVTEVAQNVASWLTANNYKSTTAAILDLDASVAADAAKLAELVAIYDNSASNYIA